MDTGLLTIPERKKSVGHRAFAFRALFIWSGLPVRVVGSVEIFKFRAAKPLDMLA